MKNIKKTLAMLASLAMAASMFTACGGDTGSSAAETTAPADDGGDAAETTEAPAVEVAADTGKTLKIYTWNEEFKDRLRIFYPNYDAEKSGLVLNETGDTVVSVGDKEYTKDGLEIEWVTTPSQDNAYQNKLDADLKEQENSDDPIDIFLIEADYALKYVNTDYTMNVNDIGVTAADLADNYKYTQDICTDDSGALKGVTWQATPGLFAYRRSIAKDVLGTDDPAEVQKAVANWDTFNATAESAKAKGYFMLSGFDDSYRVFSNNVSAPWVNDNKEIVIDDNIHNWVTQTKEFTDKGYNNQTSLWAPEWQADQGQDGKVFGFFYSTWGINFTLLGNSLADKEGASKVGNGCYGDWAVCEGPQNWYWGGTWICACKGTDNPNAVADIMKAMAGNKDVMSKITTVTQDYTNNKAAMEEIGASDFKSDFLGGQNHIALFAAAAPKIDMSKISPYDQGCNESYQGAFKDYFVGATDENGALENFYKSVMEKYPSLKRAN